MRDLFVFIMITVCGRTKVESRELGTSVLHILILLSSLLHVLCMIKYPSYQVPSYQVQFLSSFPVQIPVGIKGHAVAEAVAEAPKGVARALLYIVRASPSFLLHPSYKSFYHTLYQSPLLTLVGVYSNISMHINDFQD